MLTLGIHDGHTATACFFENGQITACISEERLNRIKEWTGFPQMSVKNCLEITNKAPEDIDAVGISSIMPQIGNESWHTPPRYKKLYAHLIKAIPEALRQSHYNIRVIHLLSHLLFRSRRQYIIERLRELGITTRNIFFFEHHLVHAATAYYTNWYKPDKTLVITLDGSGDAVCAAIQQGINGNLNRIVEVFNYNSICDFYTRVTKFLGMKPMSHEYKVMGMAPYASDTGRSSILKLFSSYYRISHRNPLQFVNTSGLWKWQFSNEFKKQLLENRFDWIAGAIQDLYEDVILKWIKNAINDTGLNHLALSGGGFMNVKLNYLISKLPEVHSLFIFPSSGDESNPVGASILAALKAGFPCKAIQPLKMIDWGPSYSVDEIERSMQNALSGEGLTINRFEHINQEVAKRLVEGKIVGRVAGRMEWGARALGNRSILADPRNSSIIHTINRAVKKRDFWMPFAPAILQEYRNSYVVLRHDYHCPFMTIAPDSTHKAWQQIPACLHPADKSTRAQILEPGLHSSFYEIVSAFEKRTGVGAVLNTSFNLHGEPIVCSSSDAIKTFLNSDIDVLQLEDYLIEK